MDDCYGAEKQGKLFDICFMFSHMISYLLTYYLCLKGLMLMLQNLPTLHWTDVEIGLVLAEAYRLKYTFADAPKHFRHEGAAPFPPNAAAD